MNTSIKNLKTKLLLVFFPTVCVTLLTVVSYHLLRWIVDYKFSLISLEENLWNIIFPMIFSGLFVYGFLKRRIRILRIEANNKSIRDVFYMIASIVAIFLIVSTSKYVEILSFDTISIQNASDVINHKNERFFHIETVAINTSKEYPFIVSRIEGKNNNQLSYTFYNAYSFENTNQTIWYADTHKQTISNRLSDYEKRKKKKEFLARASAIFKTNYKNKSKIYKKLVTSDFKEGVIAGIERNSYELPIDDLIIITPSTSREDRLEEINLKLPVKMFLIGMFILLIMILFSKVDPEELKVFKQPRKYFEDTRAGITSFKENFSLMPVAIVIVIINVIVFCVGVYKGVDFMHPSGEELYHFGAATRDSLFNGKYWQIITSFFVHSGVGHLTYNMITLFICAAFVEKKMGSILFLVLYILAGIVSVILSVCLTDGPILLIGASGAIFGVMGLMLAFNIFRLYGRGERSMIWMTLGLFGGISLLAGFATPNVGNIAHISGLLFGFVFGAGYFISRKLSILKTK
ncbi:rhomboid family intramembrane serine protease [uncultured Dokdonia sp.]|uniref:rhomboid family intramembrane serine protease n=1 Tax=uncultured Dokdonia sp. TaxID=575653 RepID=UPI002630CB94|nr:rhomboid family intramembrane serine protease [uncultured Dokdonia sp.]